MKNFILFTLALFALASLLRIEFFFTIFYLFIGVYVASRLWTRRMLRRLKVTREVATRAFLGETVRVRLHLKNLSRLPIPWLMINETFSTVLSSPPFYRQVITLSSKDSHTLEYSLTARRRGYYNIGPMRVETGDLLGINRGLNGFVDPNHLIVYPKIVPIARLSLPTHSPQVVLPTAVPLFKDPSRIIGVKSYTPGDNPRHIHWPATAAQGQVLVKKYETAIARDSAIFLNMDRENYGRPGQAGIAIELAVVVAASLANQMVVKEELPAGLYTLATDPLTNRQQPFRLPPNKGRSYLMQMLEVLARVEAAEGHNFSALLRQESVHLAWGTTIVLITGTASEALLQTILLLKRAGFNVVLALAQPAAYTYPPTHAHQVGIPVYRITREKDIEAWVPSHP